MAEETFSVGEVAIFWCEGDKFHKTEVTIISPLERQLCIDRDSGAIFYDRVYRISAPGVSQECNPCAPPRYLRKKRPPPDWVKLCKLDEVPKKVREPA